MFNFKQFLILLESQFDKDLAQTLANIPKSHAALVKDYNISADPDNTLKGDSENVGVIDEKKKKIRVAGAWNHSREFIFLHEVAHAVYKYKMTPTLKKEWASLVKSTKNQQKNVHQENQRPEELFCMIYANTYCQNGFSVYEIKELSNFIKKLK